MKYILNEQVAFLKQNKKILSEEIIINHAACLLSLLPIVALHVAGVRLNGRFLLLDP